MTTLAEHMGQEELGRVTTALTWQIFRASEDMVPSSAASRARIWVKYVERHHPAAEAAELLNELARGNLSP